MVGAIKQMDLHWLDTAKLPLYYFKQVVRKFAYLTEFN